MAENGSELCAYSTQTTFIDQDVPGALKLESGLQLPIEPLGLANTKLGCELGSSVRNYVSGEFMESEYIV